MARMNRHLFDKSNFIVVFTFSTQLAVVFKFTFSFKSFLRMQRYLFNKLNFIFCFLCKPIFWMDRYLFEKENVPRVFPYQTCYMVSFLINSNIFDDFFWPIVVSLMFFLRLIFFRSLIFVSLLQSPVSISSILVLLLLQLIVSVQVPSSFQLFTCLFIHSFQAAFLPLSLIFFLDPIESKP